MWFKLIYLTGVITLLAAGCVRIEIIDRGQIKTPTGVGSQKIPTRSDTLFPPTGSTPVDPIPTTTITLPPTKSLTPTQPTKTPIHTKLSGTSTTTHIVDDEPRQIPASVVLTANCRFGPSVVYAVVGYVYPDDDVIVEGRNPNASWFLIMMPNQIYRCWTSDQAIEFDSDPSSIPVVTPPPTPTPKLAFTPTPPRIKIYPKGDMDRNCVVNDDDYAIWSAAFGTEEGDPDYNDRADINDDGKVDGLDYGIWWKNFGQTCTYREK